MPEIRIMAEPLVLATKRSGVLRLTLQRPHKRNALTRELLKDLKSHLDGLAAQADLRLLVLGAAGSAFCAGMDLAQMQETAALPDAAPLWRADTDIYRDVVAAIFECPCPTLAVIPGPAVAGGLGIVLACDLVVASETATFALPEPRRGITAAIVTPLLTYRVSPAAAAYLLMSGESIDARRAREMGFCHVVAPPDELESAARQLEQSILTGAPGSLAMTKQLLRRVTAGDLRAQFDFAATISAQARETAEAREGLQAFLEKRPPAWIDRPDSAAS
jgi:methylglutaconyl-CoA hydratase